MVLSLGEGTGAAVLRLGGGMPGHGMAAQRSAVVMLCCTELRRTALRRLRWDLIKTFQRGLLTPLRLALVGEDVVLERRGVAQHVIHLGAHSVHSRLSTPSGACHRPPRHVNHIVRPHLAGPAEDWPF